MNDLVLASLTNLFALIRHTCNLEPESARETVRYYLKRYFGIRQYQEYIGLYDSLLDVYSIQEPDPTDVIGSVSQQLTAQITDMDRTLLVLRLMEFAAQDGVLQDEAKKLFAIAAEKFNIEESLIADFYAFIEGTTTDNVAISELGDKQADEGRLRVLRIKKFNSTLVAYDGSDSLRMNETVMQPGLFQNWPRNGVISRKNGQPIFHEFAERLFEAEQTVERIRFCARHLNFRFPNSNNGLHDFSFDLQSGEFVAIMGGSGTGKSTLQSILNGTLKPTSGSLTINGLELYDNIETMKPYIGFVPQDDLLIAELTVYENLYYTARFCFDDLSESALQERVEKTLSDLGLSAIKHLKVGSPLNKTISGGQRKRLNIALELIREPAILFLDEPTSGLSSADSENVIHLLKEQTFLGKLVLVNIHQPSSDIFKLFDRLWILDLGGYPIYDGNPLNAPTYFKEAANYADAGYSFCKTCGNINPEIMFNIIDEHTLDSGGRPTAERKLSPEEWHNRYVAKREESGEKEVERENLPPTQQKKPNALKQFAIYLKRNVKAKLTDRQFLLIALLEAPLLALVVGMLTRFSGDNGYTVFDNKNLLSYFFMAIIVAIFMGMSVCAEEIIKDRALLRREKFLQLSHAAYISSKLVFASIIALIQTGLFILVGNHLLQLSDLWLQWWLIMFCTAFLASLMGLLLSQTLSSVVAIYITIPILLIPQILLCGLVVDFDDLNQHSKTRNVPLIGEIIPSRWSFEALAVTVFTKNDYTRNFFADQAGQYELQITRLGFLRELDLKAKEVEYALRQKNKAAVFGTTMPKRNETNYLSNLPLIQNETRKLMQRWDIEQFKDIDKLQAGKADTLIMARYKEWIKRVDKQLYRQSYTYTALIDAEKQKIIDEHSDDPRYLVKLQENHTNKHLESVLVNTGAEKLVRQEDDCLVPLAGTVYLTPPSNNGRAPFYSCEKVVGDWHIDTLAFNLTVIAFMSLLLALLLYSDFPGRMLRKE
ncbi:MAG: ATP-binding cassette domain-containing protein [Bacteroidaceae bacterium]|nr:ATP-binding cassette domain-containing protein [Bacteroidaceae bacterium]